jgi:TonB family protein
MQARRAEAEGDVYVEFAVGPSGRVAMAQIRSAGLHPLLEHASFGILSRCMFRPPSDKGYRTGLVVYSWRLQ